MTATAGLRRRLATMAVIMDIKTNRKGGRAGRPKFGFLHIFSHIYLQFPVDFYLLLSSFLFPFLVHLPFCFGFHVMSIFLLLVFSQFIKTLVSYTPDE